MLPSSMTLFSSVTIQPNGLDPYKLPVWHDAAANSDSPNQRDGPRNEENPIDAAAQAAAKLQPGAQLQR